MASTKVPLRIVGGTTNDIKATAGAAKQLVYDTDKNALVLMDGATVGGHYVAMASVKVKAGSPNVKINGGAEATLADGVLTITTLPGAIPGAIVLVENPDDEHEGKFLKFNYTNADGEAAYYLVDLSDLVATTYTAGDGIAITGNQINIDPKTLGPAIIKPDGGLQADADGYILVKLSDIVDTGPDSLLQIVDGKITLKSLVSEDADNILQLGSDNKIYMPGDQGTL